MHPKECPKCGTAWEEKETIYEFFLRRENGNEEEARKIAGYYGCTPENPKHFGKDIIGIEIQGEYDGVSRWKCLKCETEFDRWTLKEIK